MSQRWRVVIDVVIGLYPWHKGAFIALNAVLTALNIYTGRPWWALWPLLITGFMFTVHYLTYKSLTVDDAWVDERAAELYDKSYDQAHIDTIAGRYDLETADKRLEDKGEDNAPPPAVRTKDRQRLLGRDD